MPFPEDYRRKLRQVIQQEFSVSLMSTSKWIKTFGALSGLDLAYRLKLITRDSPGPWGGPPRVGPATFLPRGWFEGGGYSNFLSLEVEWVEVTPRHRAYRAGHQTVPDEDIRQIEEQLLLVPAPFTWTGSVIRIWGHQRPAEPVVDARAG